MPAWESSAVPDPMRALWRSDRSPRLADPKRQPAPVERSPLPAAPSWLGLYPSGHRIRYAEAERSEARDHLLPAGLGNHGGDILRGRHCTLTPEAERSEARDPHLSLYF